MIENNAISLISSANQLEIDKSRLNILYCYIPNAFQNHLTQAHQDSVDQVHQEYGKVRRLISTSLLKYGLNKYGTRNLDNLKVTSYGKPYLYNSENIHFNISHSGSLVLCAISDKYSVGVDIEIIKPKILDYYRSYFTVDEWRDIMINEDSVRRFYQLWTRKEAIIKADGRGLQIDLSLVKCLGKSENIDGQNWYFDNLVVDDNYACAIASKNIDSVRLIKIQIEE